MRFFTALSLFTAVIASATSRPHAIAADDAITKSSVPAVPEGAPADFHITTAVLTREEARAISARGSSSRRSNTGGAPSEDPVRKAQTSRDGPITALDFYECATSGNPPLAKDCDIVISNVFAVDQALVIAPGACLLFQYSTCWGFFCSLCQRLGTDTDFIGAQLSTAQDLCVSGGAAGTIVGEDAPQWEAGFIRANGNLPNYAGEFC